MNYDKILGVGNTPTQEQAAILDAYTRGDNIAVEAKAGSSKTSTSVLLSYSDNNKKILYTAFNKKIIEEGRNSFNTNTDCRTTHSLAYSVIGHKYRHKLSRPKGGYVNVVGTISEIARFFDLEECGGYSSYRIASLIKDTVERFESSADKDLNETHVPKGKMKDLDDITKNNVIKVVLPFAKRLWRLRTDINSNILCTHDTYLKLYQLSTPSIKGYDVLIADEAQDATPCVKDIIMQQNHMQRVIIGDSHQAIYQWRRCINMFDDPALASFTKLSLSKSFRFGNCVAEIAKIILGYGVEIYGHTVDTKLGKVDTTKPYTIIYRTNSRLIADAINLLDEGKTVNMEINVKEFVSLLSSILTLLDGGKPKHPDIMIYEDKEDFLKECEVNAEFNNILKLIRKGSAKKVLAVLNSYTKPIKSDVTLITAHSSKGLTIDHVKLADDFQFITDPDINIGEVNLLYVAATRAKRTLEINPQIEELLPENTKKGKIPVEVRLTHLGVLAKGSSLEHLIPEDYYKHHGDGFISEAESITPMLGELLKI